uniref:Uncharacterized protein n=1 Tax=viral metagenome TaxID=1070528 RepID=A0A6C0JV68_9ZZZZ
MNLFVTLYVALLFVVLTPGVLLTLPKGGSKLVVAATHGLVFALVYHLTHKLVWKLSMHLDGFQDAAPVVNNVAAMKKDGFRMKH